MATIDPNLVSDPAPVVEPPKHAEPVPAPEPLKPIEAAPVVEPLKSAEPEPPKPAFEIPLGEENEIPIESVVSPELPPPAGGAIPSENNVKPPRTGRHPKGCQCGRCIQSGGTGGYEKGGAKRRYDPNGAGQPSFADVLAGAETTGGPDYLALAGITFDMATGVLSMTFGPEWQPRSPDEKNAVCSALAAYMKSKGMTDLPPGYVLSFVALAYAAPRFAVPTTRDKIKFFFGWIKDRVFGIFRRKR